jgi:hypothetical protein
VDPSIIGNGSIAVGGAQLSVRREANVDPSIMGTDLSQLVVLNYQSEEKQESLNRERILAGASSFPTDGPLRQFN